MSRANSVVVGVWTFLSATVLGAASVGAQQARAIEAPREARTRITGEVLLPDGSPAAGAVVTTSAGGQAVTGADGSFTLLLALPPDLASLEVTAVAPEPGGLASLVASTRFVPGTGRAASAGRLALSLAVSCHPRWLPSYGGPTGTDSSVRALAQFDDGHGARLYAGGSFEAAGGTPASRIARWDGQRWAALGEGVDGPVDALAVFDDGRGPALYAGGSFTTAGGAPAARIARWDGASWEPLASGIDGAGTRVRSLAVFDDGLGPALYVGGTFTSASGVPANRVARWDGASWSALGPGLGVLDQIVHDLEVFDDGSGPVLVAGGDFGLAGTLAVSGVARWNGTAWAKLGNGLVNAGDEQVKSVAVFDRGSGPELYAAGKFDSPGRNIVRWDGAAWADVGAGMIGGSQSVSALATFDDGKGAALYVGGLITQAGGVSVASLARFDGADWSEVDGGTTGTVLALAVVDDGGGARLAVGGGFELAGDVPANNIALWSGAGWNALGGSPRAFDGTVHALTSFDDGTGPALYAAGEFTRAGDVPVERIARLDGASVSPLGAGIGTAGFGLPGVNALLAFDAALIAGGNFTMAGGVPAKNVARWDGTSWSPLGAGTSLPVLALAAHDDGGGPALFAGGHFLNAGGGVVNHVARWDGTSWSALASGTDEVVRALAVLDDGSGPMLYAAGDFTDASGVAVGCIARWDGTSWSDVGGGVDGAEPSVHALVVHDDGSGPVLYAGGRFNTAGGVPANRVARWDGSSWSAVGGGMTGFEVRALAVHDDGRGPALYAAGMIGKRVARWDGSDWIALGSEIDEVVLALASASDARGPALFAGGEFDASPAGDAHLARWACRPAALR